MLKSSFFDKEKILHTTSIRCLPLELMSFSLNRQKVFISSGQFSKMLKRLSKMTEEKAERIARNVIVKLGPNSSTEERIYEILMSHDYRKTPRRFVPETIFQHKIREAVKNSRPVELVIPLFPCKAPNKLKSVGLLPDFAEILCIFRLLEICLSVEVIYKKGAKFTITEDGFKFKKAWSLQDKFITNYQNRILEIIRSIGAENNIFAVDQVSILEDRLDNVDRIKREKARNIAILEYENFNKLISLKQFDKQDYRERLEIAARFDPTPDRIDSLGRFVPLFYSNMYSVYFPEIYEIPEGKEQTLEVFKNAYDVSNPQYGEKRKQILDKAWGGTIKHLVSARTDHAIDLFSLIFPNSIRCTIHSKQGQLGLTTINKNTRIESWHGTGYFNNENDMGVDFLISLETNNYYPVFIKGDPFNMGEQPIFYSNNKNLQI